MSQPAPQAPPVSAMRAVFTALRRDTLVHLYLAVVVTEAVIYTVPLMDPGTLTVFGASPFEIPFVLTVTLAGFIGLRRLPEGDERLYWTHLAYAMLFWLATLVWVALVPRPGWTTTHAVWVDASYLMFYSPILLAVERKPHVPRLLGPRETERQLRWAGVTLLVVGYFIYFVVVPAMVDPGVFRSAVLSSLLFLTIDCAIVIRFTWRAWSCGSPRWRVLYGMMAAAGVSLLGTDGLDASRAVGLISLPDGAFTDLIWAIPPFFFLCAFRLRETDLPRAAEGGRQALNADRSLDPVRVGSFLIGSALSFPVVHFVLHEAISFDPALLHAQQTIVLSEILLFSTLGAVAFSILARERLAEERARAAFEERLRQARKLEAVSRLAGVVADEFTPSLEALASFTDRALDALAAGDPLRDQVQRAYDHVLRLGEITRNLGAVSRQRRGHPERVDVADAVSDIMPMLRSALGPSVRIETSPTRGCVTLIDPAHVRTLLLDLATNARDAMPEGGRLRIEVGVVELDAETAFTLTVRPGRFVKLVVRDTGRGIPIEVLPHLFEPFYSTKAAGEGSVASGLGLATLYAIVSQHGGCVSVTSEAGQGTSFEVLLPAV